MTVPVPGALGHPDEPAPRILLVEDDDVIREATTMALERYGFSVRTATDGLTGRTAYRAEVPDVVLLDVMMPFLDGLSPVSYTHLTLPTSDLV